MGQEYDGLLIVVPAELVEGAILIQQGKITNPIDSQGKRWQNT